MERERRYRITLLYKKLNGPIKEGTLKELKDAYKYCRIQKMAGATDRPYYVVDKYDDVLGWLEEVE
jgi:hypothetical protein